LLTAISESNILDTEQKKIQTSLHSAIHAMSIAELFKASLGNKLPFLIKPN